MTQLLPLLAALSLSDAPTSNLYKIQAGLADGKADVKVGQPAKLQVHFEVAKEAHISNEAPLTIKIGGEGVKAEKPVLHYADAEKPTGAAPRFAEEITATAPGSHTVDVDLSFYVCTAALCNRATDHQKVTVAAKE